MMARWLYRLLLWLVFPLIWLYLLKRARKQPAYRRNWGERLGYFDPATINKFIGSNTPIWLHAVSVGEMRAAAPLVKALQQQYPQHPLLLTCMTPTGRETAESLFGDQVSVVYLPYDYPTAIRRFLATFRPQLGVLMETEIWPNWIYECQRAGVPLVLANARLSDQSCRGYLKARALIAPAMAKLAAVYCQSADDAANLKKIGAVSPQIMGSVKFDNQPDAAKIALGQRWRTAAAGRRIVLLASSRDGEELLWLSQWPKADPAVLHVIVPRHPQRFDQVAADIAAAGFTLARRSAWQGEVLSADVLLGDSMGEMPAWFAMADLAVMGGSLLPFGSQNLIEAAACGCPVLLGPSVFNFAEAAKLAVAAGAARQQDDTNAVAKLAHQLLSAPDELATMREAGLAFSAAHRGATDRLMAALAMHLC